MTMLTKEHIVTKRDTLRVRKDILDHYVETVGIYYNVRSSQVGENSMKTQLNAAKIIPFILPLPSWSSWNQSCYREKVGYDWVLRRWRSTNRSHWSMNHNLSIFGIRPNWQDYKGFKTSPFSHCTPGMMNMSITSWICLACWTGVWRGSVPGQRLCAVS